jgi:hypothetical protein
MAEVFWTVRDMSFHGQPTEGYDGPKGFFVIPAGTRCTRARKEGIVAERLAAIQKKDPEKRTFVPVHLEGMIRYVAEALLTTEESHADREHPPARPASPRARARGALAVLAKKPGGRVGPGHDDG